MIMRYLGAKVSRSLEEKRETKGGNAWNENVESQIVRQGKLEEVFLRFASIKKAKAKFHVPRLSNYRCKKSFLEANGMLRNTKNRFCVQTPLICRSS